MNFDQALDLLDELGSKEDPIWYEGEESTPDDLGFQFDGSDNPAEIRITFYSFENMHDQTEGTLFDLVLDRLNHKVGEGLKPDLAERVVHMIGDLPGVVRLIAQSRAALTGTPSARLQNLDEEDATALIALCAYSVAHGNFRQDMRGFALHVGRKLANSSRQFEALVEGYRRRALK